MPKTEAVELSMARWASLQFHVRWAYRGTPVLMHTRATKNDSVSAWLIEKGSVRLVMNDRDRRVGAGQWVVFPPGQVAFEFSENARILSVSFYAAWIDGQPQFFRDEFAQITHGSKSYAASLTKDSGGAGRR